MSFMGPPNAMVIDRPYKTVTSGGIKAEGTEMAYFGTPAEAWGAFLFECARYIGDADQVAWRRLPELSELEGRYAVTARLYAYPDGDDR